MNRKKMLKLIIVALGIVILLPVGITFSKYVHDFINYYVMEAKHFYFNSDKLSSDGLEYDINNWGGVGDFTIQFELNNRKNNILVSDSDISYVVDYECSEDTVCSIDNNAGTILKSETSDNFTLTISPQRAFLPGETVIVSIKARSISPYVKELTGKFNITVGKQGISYEIEDEAARQYLNLSITNALEQYTVDTKFGSYEVGDTVTKKDYLSLSSEDKAKCSSATISLSFDPSEVIIDSTNSVLEDATIDYSVVDGVSYVSKITFKMDAVSTTLIRFYKKDVSKDYTYPYGTEGLVINIDTGLD